MGHPSSPQAFTVDTDKARFTSRAQYNLLCVCEWIKHHMEVLSG